MAPKISVLIPVRNGEKTLAKCLESVLDTGYKNYEIVVVDNSSKDDTKNIIREFEKKDKKVRYSFEPKISRGAARNRGFQDSSGSIIAMIDSDCIAPKNWVFRISRPIILGKARIVQGSESSEEKSPLALMQQRHNRELLKRNIKGDYIDHIDTKNFAIKRNILEKAGGFSELGDLEDFELKIKLKELGYKIYFLKIPAVRHHHREDILSLFRRRVNQGYWSYKIYRMHAGYAEKNPEEMFGAIRPEAFFRFFYPYMRNYSRKHSSEESFFEFFTGLAWRIGLLKGGIFPDLADYLSGKLINFFRSCLNKAAGLAGRMIKRIHPSWYYFLKRKKNGEEKSRDKK